MAAYNGANYKAPATADRLAAVRENSKAVSKYGWVGRSGALVSALVHGFFAEMGNLIRVALLAGGAGAAAGFGLIMLGYEDPVLGAKHFASAPHCAFAEYLGVANARMREPGYWRHHDADRNGIACE